MRGLRQNGDTALDEDGNEDMDDMKNEDGDMHVVEDEVKDGSPFIRKQFVWEDFKKMVTLLTSMMKLGIWMI